MEQRISLITLGVDDVARARAFYGPGYFTDPDGLAWKIAHNPGFELAPDGSITIPYVGAP